MILYECLIPMPGPVYRLAAAFSDNGFKLYAVGGVVRDFLMDKEKYEKHPQSFNPKDVDLCTDARPDQIHELLQKKGVSNFGKGESFGVWVAHIDDQDFEIATFREDIGVGDGRHPESVRFCTAEEDSKRRDLTFNALYYSIPGDKPMGVVMDYGTGLSDLATRKVRVVGDPMDRFNEDKLRILRYVRFDSRYSNLPVLEAMEPRTFEAMQTYKSLRDLGVSGPRIEAEVCAGIKQSLKVSKYFEALEALGLMPAVFPDLTVNLSQIKHFDSKKRNPIVILANLLRLHSEKTVRSRLNLYNYPNEIADEAAFLVRCFHDLREEPEADVLLNIALIMDKTLKRRENFIDFGMSVSDQIDMPKWGHLSRYKVNTYDGVDVMNQFGLAEGPELGQKIRSLHLMDLQDSLHHTMA